MDWVVISAISLGLVIYALFSAQRANMDSIYKRLFWYLVIIFIPFVGPLFAIMHCKRLTTPSTVDEKMQKVLAEAYSESAGVNGNDESH